MALNYTKTLLYHMTDIHNVPSILQAKALLSYHAMHEYVSIAHSSVQQKREKVNVQYPPFGTLHHYVPFYFAPRSPMLYAIYKHNVDSYQGNQDDIVYLVTSVQCVLDNYYPYIFTDGHAIMQYTKQFNDVKQLEDNIDWKLMESTYWKNTFEDNQKLRRRQAEFLVYDRFFVKDLLGFAVRNVNVLTRLKEQILYHTPFADMYAAVRAEWYF